MDVDGSYAYKKLQQLSMAGAQVAPLPPPFPPVGGWKIINETNVTSISSSIPVITAGRYNISIASPNTNVLSQSHVNFAGLLYTYLACGVNQSEMHGAFRALTRGYNCWASGRIDQVEINTMHPTYCHVRCTCAPSMN